MKREKSIIFFLWQCSIFPHIFSNVTLLIFREKSLKSILKSLFGLNSLCLLKNEMNRMTFEGFLMATQAFRTEK